MYSCSILQWTVFHKEQKKKKKATSATIKRLERVRDKRVPRAILVYILVTRHHLSCGSFWLCLTDAGEPRGMRRGVSNTTESNSTPDSGYSLAQQQLFYFWYLALCYFFIDCVARADIFASPQKSAWFDNACVLRKNDPCRPNKSPTTKNKHKQRISRILALLTQT